MSEPIWNARTAAFMRDVEARSLGRTENKANLIVNASDLAKTFSDAVNAAIIQTHPALLQRIDELSAEVARLRADLKQWG